MADADEMPWATSIATGIGSMPGTDPVEAARLIAGELPDLPHLVELPQRGAGADMIGRAMAVCVDMPAEVTPSGWRLARREGADSRRARDFLSWDLDAAEQAFVSAPWVKIQLAGPWTLAAEVETPNGHRALLDPGAVKDLSQSLTEGLTRQLAELARRLDGTRFVVQIDEPMLPHVLAGDLSTASGFGTVPAVPPADVTAVLADLLAAVADHPTVAHCCHADAPIGLLRESGFDALALDLSGAARFDAARLDAWGEAIDGGTVVVAGLVPTVDPGGAAALDTESAVPAADLSSVAHEADSAAGRFDYRDATGPLFSLLHRLGLPHARAGRIVVTPTCGLGTATADWARYSLRVARDAARAVAERAAE